MRYLGRSRRVWPTDIDTHISRKAGSVVVQVDRRKVELPVTGDDAHAVVVSPLAHPNQPGSARSRRRGTLPDRGGRNRPKNHEHHRMVRNLGGLVAAVIGAVLSLVPIPAAASYSSSVQVDFGGNEWLLFSVRAPERDLVSLAITRDESGATRSGTYAWLVNADTGFTRSFSAATEWSGTSTEIDVRGRSAQLDDPRPYESRSSTAEWVNGHAYLVVLVAASQPDARGEIAVDVSDGSVVELLNRGADVLTAADQDFVDQRRDRYVATPVASHRRLDGAVATDIGHRAFGFFSHFSSSHVGPHYEFSAEIGYDTAETSNSGKPYYAFDNDAPGTYRLWLRDDSGIRARRDMVFAAIADIPVPPPLNA